MNAQRPDIVALQEVDRFWARSGYEDQPARLAELLGMDVCFAANVVLPAGREEAPPSEYGVAILTRFPIVASHVRALPVTHGWEPRGMLTAEIDAGARRLLVISTHLQVDQPGQAHEGRQQRIAEAAEIARRASEVDLPLIAMGDFNARPDDAELAALVASSSGLRDVWQVAGQGTGATIPASLDGVAREHIDYIFASSEFMVGRVWLGRDAVARIASDHYPVVAELTHGA